MKINHREQKPGFSIRIQEMGNPTSFEFNSKDKRSFAHEGSVKADF